MPHWKIYLKNRISSRLCRLDGILPTTELPEKYSLRQAFRDHMLYTMEELPRKVDLRSDMTPVEDQSDLGSW